MMRFYYKLIVGIFFIVPAVLCLENESEDRQEKLISTFQIVRFPNDVCIGSNSRNGTCYTSAECSDKSGTSSGSCADGFGVCCTFVVSTCGSTTAENLTYWTNPSTVSTGNCELTVCPVSDDICSLRLDLTTFVITGPSSYTVVAVRRRFGQVMGDEEDVAYDRSGSSLATNCQTDSFSAQAASPSSSPPEVCGSNSGSHMYVEADMDRCNRLNFYISDVVSTLTMTNTRGVTSAASRSWDITVTQIECSHPLLPPPGCTEYFYGGGNYILESYNYGTAGTDFHLGQQHQRMCIRRERGKCLGCFYAAAGGLDIGGDTNVAGHHTHTGGCCGYQTSYGILGTISLDLVANQGLSSGTDTTPGETAAAYNYGFDCIIIPGAQGPGEGNIGTPVATQTSTLMKQTLLASNYLPFSWPPHICGSEGSIGIGSADLIEAALPTVATVEVDAQQQSSAVDQTICTRNTPFMLEFLSDDLEGQGGEANNREYADIADNHGFQIYHTQLDC